VLGLPQIGTLAPGQQADIAVFNLDHPRHFGMHDPLIAPVTCAGSASVRYLLIGGRIVVENGAIPGLDVQKLRSDAARIVAQLAA
jgi:cytosine/adenosine deaminase-related metal-dependent hydrolase